MHDMMSGYNPQAGYARADAKAALEQIKELTARVEALEAKLRELTEGPVQEPEGPFTGMEQFDK